jgi:hypothetical protein
MDNVMDFKGEDNSLKRLAYISVFSVTLSTNLERSSSKPFNSLLGETFEIVNDKFAYIAE